MTSRERLRRCYFHEEVDRPGIFVWTSKRRDDPTYETLYECLDTHTELTHQWQANEFETPYPAETFTEPHSEDFERRVTILHTPAGDLRSSRLRSLKNQPGYQEKHLLDNESDAEKYLSLPIPEIGGDASSFLEADKEIGERGIVEVGLDLNPGGMTAHLFGSENFALLSVTNRDILHRVCERELKILINRVKFALDNKLGPFFFFLGQEYISPPLHGPKDFYDFNVKYDKPIIDLIHDAGGKVRVHCHGPVKRVIQGFLDMGADVLHPIEPPPMGDITAAEAKAILRDKICIEGNIQIADFYEKSPEQIQEQTQALIRDAFDDGKGLIVSPTADPYIRDRGETSFPQFKAMIDTVREWGEGN